MARCMPCSERSLRKRADALPVCSISRKRALWFIMVYALMNVSCAKSSLNSLSPQVRLRKNRRTGDWYFFTNWSKALVFLNTTTCATSDISLSWLIYFRRSFLRFFLPAALPKGRLCRCLFSGKRSSGKDQHHLFSVVCCLLSIGRCP